MIYFVEMYTSSRYDPRVKISQEWEEKYEFVQTLKQADSLFLSDI